MGLCGVCLVSLAKQNLRRPWQRLRTSRRIARGLKDGGAVLRRSLRELPPFRRGSEPNSMFKSQKAQFIKDTQEQSDHSPLVHVPVKFGIVVSLILGVAQVNNWRSRLYVAVSGNDMPLSAGSDNSPHCCQRNLQ